MENSDEEDDEPFSYVYSQEEEKAILDAAQIETLLYDHNMEAFYKILSHFRIDERFNVILKDEIPLSEIKLVTKLLNYFADTNEEYGNLLFLCMCIYNKEMNGMYDDIMKRDWITTQSFLYGDDVSTISFFPPSKIRGMSYKSNSCYQDSAFMALFAIPNQYITKYILQRNLSDVVLASAKFLSCVNPPKRSQFSTRRDGRLTEEQTQEYKKALEHYNTIPKDVIAARDLEIRKRIQKELNNITDYIRGDDDSNKSPSSAYTCSNIRKLFSFCLTTDDYHNTDTQDVSNFVSYLFNIFNVDFASRKITTYVSSEYIEDWEEAINNIENLQEESIYIIKNVVLNSKDVPIVKISLSSRGNDTVYLNKNEFTQTQIEDYREDPVSVNSLKPYDKSMKMQIVINELYSPNYVIFSVNRTPLLENEDDIVKWENNQEKYRKRNRVIPDEQIETIRGAPLSLHAIIVHTQNHYTCYIKFNQIWHYYNDIPNTIKKVGDGSFEDMISSSPSPTENGVLFFYS